MKVYIVLTENKPGQVLVESLHTTKEGAENRLKRVDPRSKKTAFMIAKPLKGDIMRFTARFVEHELKRKGLMKSNQHIVLEKIK